MNYSFIEDVIINYALFWKGIVVCFILIKKIFGKILEYSLKEQEKELGEFKLDESYPLNV